MLGSEGKSALNDHNSAFSLTNSTSCPHTETRNIKNNIIIEVFNDLLNALRTRINEQQTDISKYQHLLEEAEKKSASLEHQNHELIEKLSTSDHEFSIKKQLVVELESELTELRAFKEKTDQELVCVCGKKFDRISSRLGHQRKCEIYKSVNHVEVLQ